MDTDLDILGTLSRIKYPPFPTAVKSMRGTYLRFGRTALIITGVGNGGRKMKDEG